MYTASIHDPISGVQIRIIANTHTTLRQRVTDEIDQLRRQIVDLFLFASAIGSIIIFTFIVTLNLTPFGLVVMPIVVAAYLQRAPFWINPLAHVWYLRKCMRAWEQEFERITAPDTRADR